MRNCPVVRPLSPIILASGNPVSSEARLTNTSPSASISLAILSRNMARSSLLVSLKLVKANSDLANALPTSSVLRTLLPSESSLIKPMSIWIIALFVVFCYNAAANAINDYFDIETDKVNRPNRPLVTGDVKPKTALFLAIFLFFIGTILAFTLTLSATFIAVAIVLPLMVSV